MRVDERIDAERDRLAALRTERQRRAATIQWERKQNLVTGFKTSDLTDALLEYVRGMPLGQAVLMELERRANERT